MTAEDQKRVTIERLVTPMTMTVAALLAVAAGAWSLALQYSSMRTETLTSTAETRAIVASSIQALRDDLRSGQDDTRMQISAINHKLDLAETKSSDRWTRSEQRGYDLTLRLFFLEMSKLNPTLNLPTLPEIR